MYVCICVCICTLKSLWIRSVHAPGSFTTYIHTYIHTFIHTYSRRFRPSQHNTPEVFYNHIISRQNVIYRLSFLCHRCRLTFFRFFFGSFVFLNVNVLLYVCMYVCVYACMYVYMYVRMCVCMYVYVYIYIYTYVCMYVCIPSS